MKTSKEACIDIHSVEKENHIIIDIIDTEEVLITFGRIFFVQVIVQKKRGWGLGLSLTKRIIEDYHNGKSICRTF